MNNATATIIPGQTIGPVSTQFYRGSTIVKRIVGWSYPANGNAHNPTPRVYWQITKDGTIQHTGTRTLAAAKAFINEYLNAQ